MTRSFLAHVTRLTACEGDGEPDMVLVECDGAAGAVSWLSELDRSPEMGTVVRVSVEEIS